jgi:hypothetical protein
MAYQNHPPYKHCPGCLEEAEALVREDEERAGDRVPEVTSSRASDEEEYPGEFIEPPPLVTGDW